METTAALLEYEELKIEEKRVKTRLEELKEIVSQSVPEGEVVNGKQGVFTLKRRDNYTYTPETTQIAEDLKARQEEEVAKGLATVTPTFFVEYKQKSSEVAVAEE